MIILKFSRIKLEIYKDANYKDLVKTVYSAPYDVDNVEEFHTRYGEIMFSSLIGLNIPIYVILSFENVTDEELEEDMI